MIFSEDCTPFQVVLGLSVAKEDDLAWQSLPALGVEAILNEQEERCTQPSSKGVCDGCRSSKHCGDGGGSGHSRRCAQLP